MTTAITTVPSDPTTHPEAVTVRRPGRRLAGGLAAFAVGATLGWVGASAAADDTPAPTVAPAAAVVPEAAPAMTPDAAYQWAEAESTAPAMTPDAAYQWAEAERQERLEAAAECLQRVERTGLTVC